MSCGVTEDELAFMINEEQEHKSLKQQCVSKDDAGSSNSFFSACTATRTGMLCMKCKSNKAEVLIRMREPHCANCLESAIMSKVRHAIKFQGALADNDRILVGVSGGAASIGLLYCLLQLQNTDPRRPQRGRTVFDLHVVHVEEGTAFGLDAHVAAQHAADVVKAARSTGYNGPVLTPDLSSIFECGQANESKLQQLIKSVPDITGREDLITHMRTQLLTSLASELGCNKIVLGHSASLTAALIISETSKGRGYSLPADLQLVDGRWGPDAPCLVYPLREVTSKEIAYLGRLRGIFLAPLPRFPTASHLSINQLAADFMENLQTNLPSSIFTVIRTMSHLQPFPWTTESQAQSSHPKPSSSSVNKGKAQAPSRCRTQAMAAGGKPGAEEDVSRKVCSSGTACAQDACMSSGFVVESGASKLGIEMTKGHIVGNGESKWGVDVTEDRADCVPRVDWDTGSTEGNPTTSGLIAENGTDRMGEDGGKGPVQGACTTSNLIIETGGIRVEMDVSKGCVDSCSRDVVGGVALLSLSEKISDGTADVGQFQSPEVAEQMGCRSDINAPSGESSLGSSSSRVVTPIKIRTDLQESQEMIESSQSSNARTQISPSSDRHVGADLEELAQTSSTGAVTQHRSGGDLGGTEARPRFEAVDGAKETCEVVPSIVTDNTRNSTESGKGVNTSQANRLRREEGARGIKSTSTGGLAVGDRHYQLCAVCSAPLAPNEHVRSQATEMGDALSLSVLESSCRSCSFQILRHLIAPRVEAAPEEKGNAVVGEAQGSSDLSLLPEGMLQRFSGSRTRVFSRKKAAAILE